MSKAPQKVIDEEKAKGEKYKEMLQKYITKVEEVNEKSEEILNYCTRLDKDISLCIKKIGMVRYSAFKDTGSDLSFALALLDKDNNHTVNNTNITTFF